MLITVIFFLAGQRYPLNSTWGRSTFPDKQFVRKISLGSGSPASYLSAAKALLGVSHMTSLLNSSFIGLGINDGKRDTCYSLQPSKMPLISSGCRSKAERSQSSHIPVCHRHAAAPPQFAPPG